MFYFRFRSFYLVFFFTLIWISFWSTSWAWEGTGEGPVTSKINDEQDDSIEFSTPLTSLESVGRFDNTKIVILGNFTLDSQHSAYLYIQIDPTKISQRMPVPSEDHRISFQVFNKKYQRVFDAFSASTGWIEILQPDREETEVIFNVIFEKDGLTQSIKTTGINFTKTANASQIFDQTIDDPFFQPFFEEYQSFVNYFGGEETYNSVFGPDSQDPYQNQPPEDSGCWGYDDEEEDNDNDNDDDSGCEGDDYDDSEMGGEEPSYNTSDDNDDSGCDDDSDDDEEDSYEDNDSSSCDEDDDDEDEDTTAAIFHTKRQRPPGYRTFVRGMRLAPWFLTWFVIWYWKRRLRGFQYEY
jgi:hypothetical protein